MLLVLFNIMLYNDIILIILFNRDLNYILNFIYIYRFVRSITKARRDSFALSGVGWPGDGAANNDNDARNDNRVGGFRGFHGSPWALIAGNDAALGFAVGTHGCIRRDGDTVSRLAIATAAPECKPPWCVNLNAGYSAPIGSIRSRFLFYTTKTFAPILFNPRSDFRTTLFKKLIML